MRKFWAQPLRRQLLAANLLIAVPVLGLAVWEAAATYGERAEVADSTRALADTTAAFLDPEVRVLDGLADRLRAEPAIQRFEAEAAAALLSRVVADTPTLADIVLLDSDRRPLVQGITRRPASEGTAVAPDPAGVELAGGTDPAGSLALHYPVHGPDDAARGTLVLYLNLDRLRRAIAFADLPASSSVAIRPAGTGSPDAASDGGSAPGAGTDDSLERRHATATVGDGRWLVSVAMPASVATQQPGMTARQRSIVVAGVVLISCFLVAWLVSARVHTSVGELEAVAQRIAAGDFGPITRRTMFAPEFTQLQAAFDAMLERFNATRSALDAQMGEERRIRRELESLQTQVIQQERLAAVGQLVSGVAHEINNPLQAILGFAELLQMQPDVPETVKSDLRLIQKESTRACNIIRNLAMFARQQPGEAGPIGTSDVIRAVAELRQRRLQTEDIELVIDDRATQPVKAVLTELQQVLLNFVVNAEQAILGSGRLPGRITIRSRDRDGRVLLEVEDTGPGVPLASEAKLFQPFFTTKPVGQGTGLGLSISYGIIDSLGGTIGHRPGPEGGAIFHFELPAAPAAAPTEAPDTVASAGSS